MLKDIEAFIVKRARRPWKTAGAIITLALSIFGLLRGVIFLSEEFGWEIAVLAGSFLIWLILVVFYAWIMYDLRNTYNRHEKASFVYHNVIQRWHFNEDGSRNVSCEKTMLFFADPDPDELVDTLFGSVELSFDDLNYKTGEAVVARVEEPRSDAYNVFWKPPQTIYAGDVYAHTFSYLFPKGEGPFEKSITIGSLTPCRQLRMEISSDRRIKRIRVKEDGGETRFWDDEKIFAPSTVDHAGYIKNLAEHGFEVDIDRVDLDKRIFVIIEFVDEETTQITS